MSKQFNSEIKKQNRQKINIYFNSTESKNWLKEKHTLLAQLVKSRLQGHDRNYNIGNGWNKEPFRTHFTETTKTKYSIESRNRISYHLSGKIKWHMSRPTASGNLTGCLFQEGMLKPPVFFPPETEC